MSDCGANRTAYPFENPIQTRWSDNDVYGHVNISLYYQYFDTTIGVLLRDRCNFAFERSRVIPVCASNSCAYRKAIAHPDPVVVAVGIRRLGRSSVTYQLAVFVGNETDARAIGSYVHVFINRDQGQSTPIPDSIREHLIAFTMPEDTDA